MCVLHVNLIWSPAWLSRVGNVLFDSSMHRDATAMQLRCSLERFRVDADKLLI